MKISSTAIGAAHHGVYRKIKQVLTSMERASIRDAPTNVMGVEERMRNPGDSNEIYFSPPDILTWLY